MCGIAGFIAGQGAADAGALTPMLARIAHRGPDGQGTFVEGPAALGHCRLAIIDLAGGAQPLYSEDKNLVIVFNVEIYNYKALTAELTALGHCFATRTDTEVLLHGWEQWGRELLPRLRGMFAFALWDRRAGTLFCARDMFGIKPLYYCRCADGTLLFASEIKAFLDHPSFEKRLNGLGIRTFRHYKIPGYPNDVARIVSDEGYGKNDYIETQRPLVVITAPGPGSGKMATCLSQLYHEYKRGVKAGYAKFETFPIWNIPLKHPVNLAYEAATADLNDVNMIDPFHLEAYGVTTVNYNRDIEIFPVVNAMFELIAGKSPYKSPTDMGVNMAGNCIVDDAVCREASRKEILRRYFKCLCEQKITGTVKETERYKLELLMNQADLTVGQREVEKQAHARSESTGGAPAAAIELPDGTVVTGKTGPLLGAAASALMNALKVLAGIPQETDLVSAASIEPIQTLKTNYLGGKNPRLHTDEILIALSSSAASNEQAAAAMHQLPNLKGCDVHSTVLLSGVDTSTLNRLGMYLTCDPVYEEEDRKYHKQ